MGGCLLGVFVRLALRSKEFGTVGTGFVQILEFIALPTPQYAVHKGGGQRAWTECFQLTLGCINRMLEQSLPDGRSVQDRVQEAFHMFLHSGEEIPNASLRAGAGAGLDVTDSALQIPLGLCFLIKSSCWRTLALCHKAKWDADCDVFPLLMNVRNAASGCDLQGASLPTFVAAIDLQPAPQFFSMLADDLCEWGRAIIAASSDADRTISDLEQYVACGKLLANRGLWRTPGKGVLQVAWVVLTRSPSLMADIVQSF